MTENQNNSAMVSVAQIVEQYLPVSRKKARKFVTLYLEPKKIGNRLYVERSKLEELLTNPDRENFPLNF